jgi:fructosamine-3-kinase
VIAAHPFAAMFDPTRARARLEREARSCWGQSLDVTHCEVLHVWRKVHARASSAHKSIARVSYRLGLHDRRDGSYRDSLVHGLLSLEGRDVRIELRRFPEDPALPQLRQLADPSVVLRQAPAAVIAHCGEGSAATVDVVSFRPGQRCTMRVTGPGAAPRIAFAKTFCDDAGALIAARIDELSRTALAHAPGIAWPELLAYDADTRTVWQAAVPDARPFLAGPPRRSLAHGAWYQLGAVLATLHAAPLAGLDGFDRAQRLFESGKKLTKLENAGLATAAGARNAWRHCAAAVDHLPPAAAVLLHGDLHLGQLARSGDRIALFDFDEVVMGPAEQDLASLRVSVESTGAAGSAIERAFASVLAGYGAAGGRPPHDDALDWHYRLQQIDRAYRDYWRYDAAATGSIGCALRRTRRGLSRAQNAVGAA